MRCEFCAGSGQVAFPPTPIRAAAGVVGVIRWRFCEECRGSGSLSCCEGTERHAGVAGQPGSDCTMGAAR